MAIILGLDYGERRVGVAVSDEDQYLALPVTTIQVTSKEQLLNAIGALARSRRAAAIVVGLPKGLSGNNTEQTESTKRFAAAVEKHVGLPVHMVDERLTSVEAVRGGATKENVDMQAATVLLQAWIDMQNLHTMPTTED